MMDWILKLEKFRSEAKDKPLIIRGHKQWYYFPVGYFPDIFT